MNSIYAIIDIDMRESLGYAYSSMRRYYKGDVIKLTVKAVADEEALRWYYDDSGKYYSIPDQCCTKMTIEENPEYFL